MATARQIEANRKNAAKSTGPKTEAGKARARINALKHGNRSRTALPVLPHEDPRALALRIEEWTDAFRPATALERDLVACAARLSWTHDRAERAEAARLARRVARAEERAALRRLEQAEELGKDLFSVVVANHITFFRTRSGRAPAVLVRRLEATAEGCRWLIARWNEIEHALEPGTSWNHATLFQLFRLLGTEGIHAVHDPALGAILSACEVLRPGSGKDFWERCRRCSSITDHAFLASESWREIAPRPGDRSAALAALRGRIREQLDRLNERLADLEADVDAEADEAAAFSAGDDFERLHRFQSARHREMIRTLDMLLKLRRGEADANTAEADEEPRNETNEATEKETQNLVNSTLKPGDLDTPGDERSQSEDVEPITESAREEAPSRELEAKGRPAEPCEERPGAEAPANHEDQRPVSRTEPAGRGVLPVRALPGDRCQGHGRTDRNVCPPMQEEAGAGEDGSEDSP